MNYQLVTLYAGQRIHAGYAETMNEARDLLDELWVDAPMEVIHFRTGRVSATFYGDPPRWKRTPHGPIVGVVEE